MKQKDEISTIITDVTNMITKLDMEDLFSVLLSIQVNLAVNVMVARSLGQLTVRGSCGDFTEQRDMAKEMLQQACAQAGKILDDPEGDIREHILNQVNKFRYH